jgi:cell division initiation protein
MRLSPLLIKKQEFTKSMRGFDIDEVQTFLEKVAGELEEVLVEKEQLELEIQRLNEKVNEFQQIEKNLQDTLQQAQENSSKSFESTKKQTDLLIREAEVKASQLIENAKDNANEIRNAVMNLREEKDLIIAKLKAIVSTQSNLLEGKVIEAGEEPVKPKKGESKERFDIDVDGIVDKLL